MAAICVSGFDLDTPERAIGQHFEEVGCVLSVELVEPGRAVVRFSDQDTANRAVDEKNETTIAGNHRFIHVKIDGDKGKGGGKGKTGGRGKVFGGPWDGRKLMHVDVQTMGGSSVQFDIAGDQTVRYLKEGIVQELKVPTLCQTLLLDGEDLKDEQLLESLGLEELSLTLVVSTGRLYAQLQRYRVPRRGNMASFGNLREAELYSSVLDKLMEAELSDELLEALAAQEAAEQCSESSLPLPYNLRRTILEWFDCIVAKMGLGPEAFFQAATLLDVYFSRHRAVESLPAVVETIIILVVQQERRFLETPQWQISVPVLLHLLETLHWRSNLPTTAEAWLDAFRTRFAAAAQQELTRHELTRHDKARLAALQEQQCRAPPPHAEGFRGGRALRRHLAKAAPRPRAVNRLRAPTWSSDARMRQGRRKQ